MRVRSGKLRAGEEFLCTIVVKPPLGLTAGLIPSLSDLIGSSLTSVLLELLLIDGRTKGALFDCLDLNGFWPGLQDWFQIWFAPAKQVAQRRHDLGVLADRGGPMECTRSPQMLSSVVPFSRM